MLSFVSLIAIAVIAVAIAAAWSRRFLATGALVMANVIIYVLTDFGPHVQAGAFSVPVIHLELALWSPGLHAAEPIALLQLVTSMFVHADFFHLLGNLIVLLAFALPFEERIGHRAFLGLYLAAGLVGALSQVGAYWGDTMRLMGASGAVFGVIGAFAAIYPRLVVPLPLPLMFIMIFVRMRVMVGAAIFGGLQLLYLAFLSPFDNTAYMAHIGGLVGGLVIAAILIKVRGRPEDRKEHVALQITDLGMFAPDAGTRRALKEMEANRDEPAIFQAWWERFWQGARDPETGQKVRPLGRGRIQREDGTVLKTEPAP